MIARHPKEAVINSIYELIENSHSFYFYRKLCLLKLLDRNITIVIIGYTLTKLFMLLCFMKCSFEGQRHFFRKHMDSNAILIALVEIHLISSHKLWIVTFHHLTGTLNCLSWQAGNLIKRRSLPYPNYRKYFAFQNSKGMHQLILIYDILPFP